MKIKRIEHVAIAARDLESVRRMFESTFDLKLEYQGDLYGAKLAMLPVGETYLEILENPDPNSRTARCIAERGPGLFHLCFEVDDIDAALVELKAKGVRMLTEVPFVGHGDCRVAFVDPECTSNILIELLEAPAVAR
jgi:methylmalonyl-CoA epimerase